MSIFNKPVILGYLATLGISQFLVIMFEALNYEFPSADPYLGRPYNPWPGFWQQGLGLSIFMIFLGSLVVWFSSRKRLSDSKIRLLLISVITLFFMFIIWLTIGLSVQSVKLTYMASINANPLYYWGRLEPGSIFIFIYFDLLSSKIFWLHIAIGCLETIETLVTVFMTVKQTYITHPKRSPL